MMQASIRLRLAVSKDVPALRELIDKSVRGLQTLDYTPAQIEGALQTVFGVDSQKRFAARLRSALECSPVSATHVRTCRSAPAKRGRLSKQQGGDECLPASL